MQRTRFCTTSSIQDSRDCYDLKGSRKALLNIEAEEEPEVRGIDSTTESI
jgi:hypothetical protein